jgi:predicted Zn-dependent protease
VYYAAGLALRSDRPLASAAFYWAGRIDPSWAQPIYERWSLLPGVALFPDWTVLQSDSLLGAAYDRDPFFDDHVRIQDFATGESLRVAVAIKQARGWYEATAGRQNDASLAPCSNPSQPGCPPPPPMPPPYHASSRWYVAYGHQNFATASRLLAERIAAHPDTVYYYYYRAKTEFFLAHYDSTVAILEDGLARLQRQPSTEPLPAYATPERFVYAIGVARQTQGLDSAARAAFRRSVALNPRFYMGHLRLANAALAAHDTVGAIAEARAAADVGRHDPVVQLFLGYTLLTTGHHGAAAHLDAAVRADSTYALPYLYLAGQRLTGHDTAAAAVALRGFLARARRDDDQRETASRQLAALGVNQ